MVSIVIVSHIAKLAEGVRELANQMVQGKVDMAVAGGIDDPDNPIGTDAMKVLEAIESVYNDDGVLVLMDLGSALLSAEMALEFLEPERQANVYLCEAPLVEGTMAAAVQASIGANIQQVISEARGALGVKAGQLGLKYEGAIGGVDEVSAAPQSEAKQLLLMVQNRLGLHARPAARFVSVASQFKSDIQVGKGGRWASAKSINQVATLGVRQGEEIIVSALGEDASQALAAIEALAGENFGDADDDVEKPHASPILTGSPVDGVLIGIPASPGIAIGPVVRYQPQLSDITTKHIDDSDAEWSRLQAAISMAQDELAAIYELSLIQVGADKAAIFEAHLLFLQDPALVDEAKALIFEQKINAESAWQQVIEAMTVAYESLDDEYMRGRAADVVDVGQRVLRQVMDVEPPSMDFDQPSILVSTDLTPSDTTRLDPADVIGICTELGGATAHSAILARALGIPAVVGLGPILETVTEGQTIALDGQAGHIWLQPDSEQLSLLAEQRSNWREKQQEAKVASQKPALTRDGYQVEIAANIGRPHDAAIALEFGAEGVGLFRTEFLFLDRDRAPTEDDQFEAYRQAADIMDQLPLIIRTLDIGGDKPLPYIDLGQEDNPFLGWRGIRFCLDHPEIFKSQLRAILRASLGRNVKIMFPMVSNVDEVKAAKALMVEAKSELADAGIPYDENIEVGIMIEVPAAVAVADQLAAEVDFFSIGTNDLTQYVMAADRGNSKVAGLADALQPAVLRLIQQTVEAAHSAGIWVGMCGELAGNVSATPILIGLGLDELSMNAPAVPDIKSAVRGLTLEKARQVAKEALQSSSVDAVRKIVDDYTAGIDDFSESD
jgi:phosphocarrier protein FPr